MMANLEKMSKKQLETYARTELGVELDRRHNKKQLLAKVLDLVEERVEVIKPPPSKHEHKNDKEVIEDIVSVLNEEPYNIVLAQVREKNGDNLVKIREEIIKMDGSSQQNYSAIIKEIDKYNIVGE